jgi:hypothetical protein
MPNYFRTALLLAALTAIFMVGGFLLAGPQGIVAQLADRDGLLMPRVYIIDNPRHAHKHDSLFSTHPNTANRVARLREMTGNAGNPDVTNLTAAGPWSRSGSHPGTRLSGPSARK